MEIKLFSAIKKTFNEEGKILTKRDTNEQSEMWEYDDKGRVKLHRNGVDCEVSEYDENGVELCTNSKGCVKKNTYNNNGNILTSEFFYKYNEACKMLPKEITIGYSVIYSYDDNGELISEACSTGTATIWINTYNTEDKIIKTEASSGHSEEYTYDDNGNLLSILGSDNRYVEILNDYDVDGKIVSSITHIFKVNDNFVVNPKNIQQRAEMGFENKLKRDTLYTFLEDGRVDKFVCNTGYWVKYNYDENGDIISCVDSKGFGTMCI